MQKKNGSFCRFLASVRIPTSPRAHLVDLVMLNLPASLTDLQDFEMETLNDLFTQWLPVTLLITGTIDKRAPQPHINDLRACGFTNGLVLLFLYLGTFLCPGRVLLAVGQFGEFVLASRGPSLSRELTVWV